MRRVDAPRPPPRGHHLERQRLPPHVHHGVDPVEAPRERAGVHGEVGRPVDPEPRDALPHQSSGHNTGCSARNSIIRRTNVLEVGELGAPAPVDPRRLVVLVVGVVVATLRPGELVAGDEHRRAVAQQQQSTSRCAAGGGGGGNLVGDVRSSLPATVPRAVVVGAVGVVPAVGLVVLAVVRDEVVHREPVVRGEEVERLTGASKRSGLPWNRLMTAGRARPRRAGTRACRRGTSFHCDHRVGEPASDLVAHQIPRFGDQPDATPRAPVADRPDERRIAREHGREVEAEAVDAEIGETVERRHHQRLRRRRRASTMLPVPASSTYEPSGGGVVVVVGQPAQVVRRTVLVLLGRVVEHDVEPHLDVVIVRGCDERRQLGGGVVAAAYWRCTAPNTSGMYPQ